MKILSFINRKRFFKECFLGSFLLFNSCAYRFSNLHAKPPKGVRTIAVEAIYDSSQVPIPHDLLWKSLQQAVAASGHLKLSAPSDADAILRVHIENASLSPSGTSGDVSTPKEPRITDSGQTPPSYSKYESMTNARALYSDNTLSLLISAEVWNLSTKQMILQRSYAFANGFRAFRGDEKADLTLKSNFVQYQEAFNTSVTRIGRDLANRIVSDLLVQ